MCLNRPYYSTGVAFGQTPRDNDRRIASGVHAQAFNISAFQAVVGYVQDINNAMLEVEPTDQHGHTGK